MHICKARRRGGGAGRSSANGWYQGNPPYGWEDTVDHLRWIWATGPSFDHWVENADDQVTARFRAALGCMKQSNLLDAAYGPGRHSCDSGGAASVVAFDERRCFHPITGAGGGADAVLCA